MINPRKFAKLNLFAPISPLCSLSRCPLSSVQVILCMHVWLPPYPTKPVICIACNLICALTRGCNNENSKNGVTFGVALLLAKKGVYKTCPTKPSARRRLCSFVRIAYIKHQYMGDTIHLCHGVPCQPRQWTWNRHAPRQVRGDSMSCPNDGGRDEHNRLRALGWLDRSPTS